MPLARQTTTGVASTSAALSETSALGEMTLRASNRIAHRGVELDTEAHSVACRGKPVELAPREFAVLEALIAHPGRTLTRRQLEERLYAWGREVESNAIEVHVHHLRAKLYPQLIRTVRGVGYVIDA